MPANYERTSVLKPMHMLSIALAASEILQPKLSFGGDCFSLCSLIQVFDLETHLEPERHHSWNVVGHELSVPITKPSTLATALRIFATQLHTFLLSFESLSTNTAVLFKRVAFFLHDIALKIDHTIQPASPRNTRATDTRDVRDSKNKPGWSKVFNSCWTLLLLYRLASQWTAASQELGNLASAPYSSISRSSACDASCKGRAEPRGHDNISATELFINRDYGPQHGRGDDLLSTFADRYSVPNAVQLKI